MWHTLHTHCTHNSLFPLLQIFAGVKAGNGTGNTLTAQQTGKDGGGCYPRPLDSPNTSNNYTMNEELIRVADLITANIIHCTKEVLTSDEAARYLGISKSYLYKLTMQQKIPHYKPLGKMCYFNRGELEQWLQSNRVSTEVEISQQAQQHCTKKGGNYGV